MNRLRQALQRTRRRSWTRYTSIRGRYRWPATLVLGFFLLIIFANLTFGSVGETVAREFRLGPGEEQSTSVQVDSGRNSDVRWEFVHFSGAEPEVEAIVTGPAFRSEVSTNPEGRISFKGGFSRGEYTFTMRNISEQASGVWLIEWTLR